MNTTRLEEIRNRIETIKLELVKLDAMRPGALAQQYRNREERKGLYYQLSYSHQGKSRTKHVRPHEIPAVQSQLSNYKYFKQLTDEWIALAIEECELMLAIDRQKNTAT